MYFCRCVVWTGDGRVFFYNPSSRTSVWERPDELTGRADVDKLVSNPPDVVTGGGSNSSNSTSGMATSAMQTNSSGSETGTKREANDVSSTPPSKKVKTEETPKGNIELLLL